MAKTRPGRNYDEVQRIAILAVFCVVASGIEPKRDLFTFFDPIPSVVWANAWLFLGSTVAPAQPHLESSGRGTAIVAPTGPSG